MYHLHKKLPSNIKGCHYESKNELISDLENILQEGDKVLVKSSKSVIVVYSGRNSRHENKLSLNVRKGFINVVLAYGSVRWRRFL